MENELTLEELYLLMNSMQEKNHQEHKFLAALQGVDLDEGKKDAGFDSVKQRAAAAIRGKTEQEYVLDMIGIEMEEDDD